MNAMRLAPRAVPAAALENRVERRVKEIVRQLADRLHRQRERDFDDVPLTVAGIQKGGYRLECSLILEAQGHNSREFSRRVPTILTGFALLKPARSKLVHRRGDGARLARN
jgi:hypothetical protein